MDRLKGKALIVNIHNFHQGVSQVAGFQVLKTFSCSQLFFLKLIPHCLSGGKTVVSVSHCKQEGISQSTGIFLCQLFQCSVTIIQKLTIHGITHNGASLHHQITLIQGSKRASLYSLSTGLHQHTGLVVYQQHNVGQLQVSSTANFHAGRNTFWNGSFCSTNQGLGKRLPLIAFQINCHY